MQPFLTHWKSTANGALAFFITTGTILIASGSTLISPHLVVWITLGLAVARGWVGMLEKDADKVTTADVVKANSASKS